jgi:cystathionine beta-lyase
VTRALHERVSHGIYGYEYAPDELRDVICARLKNLYDWEVAPEALVFLPGVVPGFNLAARAFVSGDEAVMVQTPVYPYILKAAAKADCRSNAMELTARKDAPTPTYAIDFDIFEQKAAAQTRMFILCNPHNPVGRVFNDEELTRMADLCLRHQVLICSDEIHCDLLFAPHQHIPIASLAPEIDQNTITLMAPSKTYNIAGLQCAFAVIANPALRKPFQAACHGIAHGANILGYTAALAAYKHGQPWLEAALDYMRANRDFVAQAVREQLPGVTMQEPEGTYLGWLDCRAAGIPGNPQQFFLEQARVALNDGESFGPGGEGFVRLNFGCPRSILVEAITRMRAALINR